MLQDSSAAKPQAAVCGFAVIIACLVTPAPARAGDHSVVGFHTDDPGRITVLVDAQPIATYVYEDDQISRPYFANVRAPGGIQVTRNHPPIERVDVMDHPEFHPGIWMAFGDLGGSDYWRLKAPVRHVEFTEPPRGGDRQGTFAASFRYLDEHDPAKTVCEEVCRYTIHVRPSGYLIDWDTTFSSTDELSFGDQEEMGLGVRVASAIRVENQSRRFPGAVAGGGTILDADGRRNEDQVWGNASAWCDYSGPLDGMHAGITIFCHPTNFRPSWFHARDYGFVTANPFGRQAFRQGEKSKVVVKPGELLRLRYGVLLHADPSDQPPNLDAAYKDYLELTAN